MHWRADRCRRARNEAERPDEEAKEYAKTNLPIVAGAPDGVLSSECATTEALESLRYD